MRTVEIKVLGTTDVHGHIRPHTYFEGEREQDLGMAKIATLLERERQTCQHVLFVDSGDLLQGSPLIDWFRRNGGAEAVDPMVETLSHLGLAAWGVGNHDFNYGLDLLFKAQKDARYPFVSSNVYWARTPDLVFDPYVIKEVGGVKVGFIGATPPGVVIWDKAHVEGRMEFGDIVTAFALHVPEMKSKGADLVIGLPHTGLGGDGEYGPTYGGYSKGSGLPPENVGLVLAREIEHLDALFLGHTHQPVAMTENGVAIVQAEMGGKRLACVHFVLESWSGGWKVVHKAASTVSTQGVLPHPDVLRLGAAAHEATLEYVSAPIATTRSDWPARNERVEDTPLMDLIHAVQLERTGAQLSAVSAFNTDIGLLAGPVSLAQIAAIYPVENTLVAIRVTGRELREFLEYSARYFAPYQEGSGIFEKDVKGYNFDMVAGVDYEIDITRPVGSRITRLEYLGAPVNDEMTFSFAMNSYRQRGGGGYEMIRSAPVVYSQEENIRELVVDFLRERGAIEPADVFVNNWRIVPPGLIDTETFTYRAAVPVT
ncbi:MAG: 5'-nucleotidase C-terminal domain-containing protein [Candidatus Sericytochromatia bacterium]|nr:5'-nucleotidase C-terminal domain-containing protein [Candidatus Tanganyikabacteria bacterium]